MQEQSHLFAPSDAMNRPEVGRLLRGAVFLLSILGIPLLISLIGVRHLWHERERLFCEARERQIDEAFGVIESSVNPLIYLTTVLRTFEDRLSRLPRDRARLAPEVQKLRERFPGVFAFTFLDGNGAPMPEFCDTKAPKVLLQKFFLGYRKFVLGDFRGYERERATVRSFLGPFVPFGENIHSRVIHAFPQAEKRFIYIAAPTSRGMFFVHIKANPDWDTLSVRDHLHRLNRRHQNLRLFLMKTGEYPRERMRALGIPDRLGTSLLRTLGRPASTQKWLGNQLWGRRFILPGHSLVGRLLDSGREGREQSLRQKTIGTVTGFTLLMLLVMYFLLHLDTVFVSVRFKLIGAFLFTAGIPLSIMAGTAHQYLTERSQVMHELRHQEMEKALLSFDTSFPRTVAGLELKLAQMFSRETVAPGETAASLQDRFLARKPQLFWDLLKLLNEQGKPAWVDSNQLIRESQQQEMKMWDKIAVNILRQFNRPLSANYQELEDRAFSSDKIGDTDEMEYFYSRFTVGMGKLKQFDVADASIAMFLSPLLEKNGRARYLVMMVWSRKRLEREYVAHSLTTFARTLTDASLYAHNRNTPEFSCPAEYRHRKRLTGFQSRILSSDKSARAAFSSRAGGYLVTGLRGKELSEFNLVAVSSDRMIRAELQRIGWEFGILGMAMAMVSGTIGFLLAQKFLVPIRHLADGVKHLQNRRFDFQIPIGEPDELGRLSHTFNTMSESLKDLEIARTLQETLFPSGPLTLGRWEIFGSCVSASQVGGDYFDYFVLDEQKALLLIGDVSGHGVSAALVMAMAKAVVAHPDNRPDPVSLLDMLQAVFFSILKRKKMMTCFLAIISAETDTIAVSNAGQSYPYLVRAGGVGDLAIAGNPLGARKKSVFTAATVSFEPGEWMLCYTDGFIEACGHDGNPVGYEQVRDALPGLGRSSAAETEQALRAWHSRIVAPGPQEDDITLVVLRRKTA